MTDRFLEPWRLPALFHVNEDVCSLAVRTAVRGSMTSKQFAYHYLDGKGLGVSDVVATDRMIERLAVITGIDESVLLWNAFPKLPAQSENAGSMKLFRGVSLPPGSAGVRKRLAPGVLRSDGGDPYVRLAWRFEMLPGDPETGEALVAKCPECLRPLTWDAPDVCTCGRCGFDIRRAKSAYLSEGEVKATRALAQSLGVSNGSEPQPLNLSPPFGSAPLTEQFAALAWLAKFRGLVEGTHLVPGAANAYLGLEYAQNWHRTLEQFVSLIFRQTAGQVEDISRNLVSMFNDLPGDHLKQAIIDQVTKLADKVGRSHTPTFYTEFSKVAQYTTFSRQAPPHDTFSRKKRSTHFRRRSNPATSRE